MKCAAGRREAAPEEHRAQWAQPVRAMVPGFGSRVSGFGGPGLWNVPLGDKEAAPEERHRSVA